MARAEQQAKQAWLVREQGRLAAAPAPAADAAAASKPAAAGSNAVLRFAEAAAGVLEVELEALRAFASSNGLHVVPRSRGRASPERLLRYTLEAIVRGEAVLYERGAVPPAPRPDQAGRAVFDLGAGLAERYQPRPDGIEQSFVLPARPPGDPEQPLVVRGKIGTRLEPDLQERAAPTAPILFRDGDEAVLSYGGATAIDAAGRALRVPTVWTADRRLEIRVPGEWLAAARYPVVIDPLIGTVIAVTTALDAQRHGDLAYSVSSDRFLVVWEEEFSSVDHDIFGRLYSGTGTPIGGEFVIDASLADALAPAVAWNASENVFLVAWQQLDRSDPSATFDVWAEIVNADGSTRKASFAVHRSPSVHTEVDVGGHEETAGYPFLVVWQTEIVAGDLDVAAKAVDVGGAVGNFQLAAASGQQETRPRGQQARQREHALVHRVGGRHRGQSRHPGTRRACHRRFARHLVRAGVQRARRSARGSAAGCGRQRPVGGGLGEPLERDHGRCGHPGTARQRRGAHRPGLHLDRAADRARAAADDLVLPGAGRRGAGVPDRVHAPGQRRHQPVRAPARCGELRAAGEQHPAIELRGGRCRLGRRARGTAGGRALGGVRADLRRGRLQPRPRHPHPALRGAAVPAAGRGLHRQSPERTGAAERAVHRYLERAPSPTGCGTSAMAAPAPSRIRCTSMPPLRPYTVSLTVRGPGSGPGGLNTDTEDQGPT
ncbi:MAG: hypothetical protein KatS3mg102_1150 [Planctomycetota bacterium]|nr:MAG: hypothetical protein KatS3mg102_1150 [Planctomycetota bacterium]